jgi:glycosyltransferase involved in cell wall biosynthesis
MIVGLLPAVRGGLGELAKSGQHSRLIDGYLRPYARAFDEVRYFSYLDEALADWTDDAEVLARVRLLPGRGHPWLQTLTLPWRHARALRTCAALRVFQVTGALPAVVARRRWGVPFVVTYGFWYTRLARSRATALLRGVVERLGLAAAAGVIVTTAELAAHVATRTDPAKVHLIPNGVDTARFRPVARTGDGAARILYVGRLSAEKNLGAVLHAAARLRERVKATVVFVGEGAEQAALQAQAAALGVALQVRPFVDHRRLPEVFGGADVFVLPSFTEGHPKVLLEAMACGLPCVASDVGGNRSILADGDTGLLVPPADHAALAERLAAVLTDRERARRLGERARAAVLASYDLERLVDSEIALVKRVAAGR